MDIVELHGGPSAVDQTGNLTVWAVKDVLDKSAPSLADLTDVDSHRITYSFLPGGWVLGGTQERLTDDRLTSPVTKESLGKLTSTLGDLSYVDSEDPTSAAVILKDGGEWFFIERRRVDQTELAAVGDKVRVVHVTLGKQIPGPVDGTGKFTLTQAAAIESVSEEIALVA